MSNATWTVSGVLSDLIEDEKRAEIHVTVDDGVIVMYLRLDGSKESETVAQNARDLIGEKIVASGVIEPHANEAKLRSPYFLSPSKLRAG
jgi:hypothetical protein